MTGKKARQQDMMPEISEKTLLALFDYQLFENEPSLRKLIDEVENEYGTEISDDDLSLVSAAGETMSAEKHRDKKDGTV